MEKQFIMLEALISNKFILLSFTFSYLLGSIPFGYILFKYFKSKDIRSYGSGNIGATNVNRLLGKKVGAITLFLDFIKVVIPTYVANLYLGSDYGAFCGVCSILGHIFPIWLKFKGGKGVATYIGILFSINILYGIIFILSWLIIFVIWRFSSLSSLIATLSIPIFVLLFDDQNSLFFFLIMFILIFYTHRENIKRLKNKEETKTKIY